MPACVLSRFMAKPTDFFLTPRQVWWLLASATTAVAPLVIQTPLWLTTLTALLLAWRILLAWRRLPMPPRWLINTTGLAGAVAVFIQYRTVFGQNAGIALLLVLLALKQLEARKPRDGLAVVFLCYFLILAQFLYSQAMPAALAAVAGVILTTAALAVLNNDAPSPSQQLRRAGRLLIQATPLMLVLFVLFPRVQGPLWGLPRDAHSALTGLSDTMEPGAISNLSQSGAVAFRVKFEGEPPPRHQLYWRGPVLTEFDGRTWRPSRTHLYHQLPYASSGEGGYRYAITLEPNNQPWLFALELPARLPADTRISPDYLLHAKARVTQRLRYELHSDPALRPGRDEQLDIIERALILPPGTNPRTQELGRSWRMIGRNDRAILGAAITFFQSQGLTYTLTPPLLGRHTADEFLFDSKRGFCEHFANAFVVALRAAAVPARVVTGYQGGELNPVDGYMVVHQYDAHAWTEAWLAGEGWVRIDPTAIAAPSRIEGSLAAALPTGEPLPLMMRLDADWLREMRYRWDAAANAWNQWVLNYTPERQRQFLQALGMPAPDWQRMTATLAIVSGLLLLGLLGWVVRQRRQRDPVAAIWDRFRRKLARRGLTPRPWEGPRDLARRIALARPDLGPEVLAIAELYGAVRYGDQPRVDELRRRVASFRP